MPQDKEFNTIRLSKVTSEMEETISGEESPKHFVIVSLRTENGQSYLSVWMQKKLIEKSWWNVY